MSKSPKYYQAMNAIQIAKAQGADQYAPDMIAKASQELTTAGQLMANEAGRSQVVTAAREAAETAEDAHDPQPETEAGR